jgi:integrase
MKRINVRDNNGRCLLRFTHQGKTHSLTLGDYRDPRDKLKAEMIALEIAETIDKGEFEDLTPWKAHKVEISKQGIIEELRNRLSDKYDTFYSSLLGNLEKYDKEVRNKTEAKKFFEWMEVSTASKRRYYTAIRRIEELKPIFEFQIKAKKGEKKREIDPFTTEEVEKIKEGLKGEYYEAFILFLLHTGCRPSEAIGIQWKDIEFNSSRIRFHESLSRDRHNPGKRIRKETKTGKTRFTPLSEELRETLIGMERKGDLIFTTSGIAHGNRC